MSHDARAKKNRIHMLTRVTAMVLWRAREVEGRSRTECSGVGVVRVTDGVGRSALAGHG